jgi:hypothetical protein
MSQADPGNPGQILQAIDQADEAAAAGRVTELRELYPEATAEALVGMLIKQKCLQTGAIGEVVSSASIIPGVGVFVSLLFGAAADVTMTARMQAELVLEIAEAYQRRLDPAEQQRAFIVVAGNSQTAGQLLADKGQAAAQRATAHLSQEAAGPARLNVAGTAGANTLTTYLIGRRSATYFQQGAAAVESWPESIAGLTESDESTIVAWLAETTYHSWHLVRKSSRNVTDIVIVAGKSLGEVTVLRAGLALGSQKAGALTAGVGDRLSKGAGVAVETLGKAGQAGLAAAGTIVVEVGAGLIAGVTKLLSGEPRKTKAGKKKKPL